MREVSESVEYWSLSTNQAKQTAEIIFLRPGGGRVLLTVPMRQLIDLKCDIDREAVSGPRARPSPAP